MKRAVFFFAALLLCLYAGGQDIQSDFRNPPQSSRIRVWWHWMNGNITKDGVKKDLEWMDRAGIGGFQQFDAGGNMMGGSAAIVEKVPYMTDAWKDAFRYAIHIADSLGLEAAIASAPGWSSTGGPWVKPENAMKKLTWRTVEVTSDGKKPVNLTLPEVYNTIGKFQNVNGGSNLEPWSRNVAVVAIRVPEGEKSMTELGAKVSSSGGDFSVEQLTDGDLSNGVLLPPGENGRTSWIQYEFDSPQTIKALSLVGGTVRGQWASEPPTFNNELQCSNDGVNWKTVCKIASGAVAQQTVTVPATTAKYFRLVFPAPQGGGNAMGRSRGPAGANIAEFVLHNTVKVNHAEEKAGFAAPHDLYLYDTPSTVASDAVQEVVVLDNFMNGDVLSWNAPAGVWRIYRFGASLTGKQNHPAPPEATGLEVDKLDKAAWMDYFRNYMNMYKEAAGGMVGQRGIQYILTDSYEAEEMTWTPTIAAEFKARRGYDLTPWMPALTGEVIRSSEETEKFLFDWRQTIGELFAENYDRINEIVKEYGMKGRYTEAHENGRVFVGDGMDLKMTATVPMSAIWMPNAGGGSAIPMAIADIKESSSTAHVYGSNIAAAESFTSAGNGTSGNAYSYHPGNIKYTADLAMSYGLNRFVIHESAHQPSDAHRPGMGLMIFGQWFNRHETWAEYARYWTDYLARSCYMLQQGKYVADVLFFYGEDTNITGIYGHELPEIPAGYSFDFINPYGVLNVLSVSGNDLVTKSGMKYKVLVLGDHCSTMSLEVLRKLQSLVNDGAILVGKAPEKAASLLDDEAEFERIVSDIWYSGRKNVHTGLLSNVLKGINVAPDFTYVAPAQLSYVHRHLDNGTDIYWVRNFSDDNIVADLTLRSGEGTPMLWDPETGKTSGVECVNEGGVNKVHLPMVANQAVFVVFDGKSRPSYVAPSYKTTTLLTVSTPWTLHFSEGVGAPESAVFPALKSLTESDDPGVKYFSGTATYTTKVNLTAKQLKGLKDVAIDLGDVENMADVYVNGQHVGFIWKAPFCLGGALSAFKPGANTIEIKVTNTWPNRLIGDAQPDAEKKYTYSSGNFYRADAPLRPAGLLGPVKLLGLQ